MRTTLTATLTLLLPLAGCATFEPPPELTRARTQYDQALRSATAQQNPAGLYDAKKALDIANDAFADDPASEDTRDYAYLALRKVELANAKASTDIAARDQQRARMQGTAQGGVGAQPQGASEGARPVPPTPGPAQTQRAPEQFNPWPGDTSGSSADAHGYRTPQNQGATPGYGSNSASGGYRSNNGYGGNSSFASSAIVSELSRIGAVKPEARGLVMVLPGEELFSPQGSVLLPQANQKLSSIAQTLSRSEIDGVVVEGHASAEDSENNLALSQRRAQVVRDFLVANGVSAKQIVAMGYGNSRPQPSVGSSRDVGASNGRVELIIRPSSTP